MRLPEAIEQQLATWDALAEEFGGGSLQGGEVSLPRARRYALRHCARRRLESSKKFLTRMRKDIRQAELKHGPNALVDDKLPVVVLATCDHHDPDSQLRYRRTLDVMKEVRSRRGTAGHGCDGGRIRKVAGDCGARVLRFLKLRNCCCTILEVMPPATLCLSHRSE